VLKTLRSSGCSPVSWSSLICVQCLAMDQRPTSSMCVQLDRFRLTRSGRNAHVSCTTAFVIGCPASSPYLHPSQHGQGVSCQL
jgi:hypothetical protein